MHEWILKMIKNKNCNILEKFSMEFIIILSIIEIPIAIADIFIDFLIFSILINVILIARPLRSYRNLTYSLKSASGWHENL